MQQKKSCRHITTWVLALAFALTTALPALATPALTQPAGPITQIQDLVASVWSWWTDLVTPADSVELAVKETTTTTTTGGSSSSTTTGDDDGGTGATRDPDGSSGGSGTF